MIFFLNEYLNKKNTIFEPQLLNIKLLLIFSL